MSRSSRRALFYVFCLIFLLLGTGIVLFAQGWRMDFPSFRISKVGGIYIRSYPEGTDIFLNGKPIVNQPGFLSHGTLISDLFPRTYHLALTAPNYHDWHENVTVSPSFVSNHKYAVLVPAGAAGTTTSTVTDFVASRNSIALETPGGEIVLNGKTLGFGKLIAASPDLRSIIFQTAKGIYEFANVSAGTITNLSNILSGIGLDATAPDLFFDPAADTTVIAASAGKVGLIDMMQSTGTIIGAASRQTIAPSVAVSPSTIVWTRSLNQANSSSLLFYDLSLENITSTTIALGSPIKKLTWITGSILGVLAENSSFYLYDVNQQNLQKIADDVRSVSVTTDGSRIAALESRSLEIFTLDDPNGYYRFNLPNVSDAQAALWYRDDDHLFVSYPDQVSFLDLEDASLANFITVSSGTAPQYDSDANALYLIDFQNHLRRFDFAK